MENKRVIFQGFGYTASIAGFNAANGPFLCVCRNVKGKNKGKYLSGKEALSWADSIKTAIDAQEARALCSAIYNT